MIAVGARLLTSGPAGSGRTVKAGVDGGTQLLQPDPNQNVIRRVKLRTRRLNSTAGSLVVGVTINGSPPATLQIADYVVHAPDDSSVASGQDDLELLLPAKATLNAAHNGDTGVVVYAWILVERWELPTSVEP